MKFFGFNVMLLLFSQNAFAGQTYYCGAHHRSQDIAKAEFSLIVSDPSVIYLRGDIQDGLEISPYEGGYRVIRPNYTHDDGIQTIFSACRNHKARMTTSSNMTGSGTVNCSCNN